jgi:DedD protein
MRGRAVTARIAYSTSIDEDHPKMDKALKQRLVGATVLIALAVIVLPMLLSGRPENGMQQSQKIELPPRPEEVNFETRRFPVGDEQDGKEKPAESGAAAADNHFPAPPSAAPDTSEPALSGADSGEMRPPAADAPQMQPAEDPGNTVTASESSAPALPGPDAKDGSSPTAAAAPAGQGRYVVQVASLGSSENASRLMQTLQGKGFAVLLDVIDADAGQLNRVRVGPFGSEAEAGAAAGRIGKEVQGVNPRVVDLQPEQSTDVVAPADSLARWVVQVGVFADADNAKRLVKQIRDDGMSAYSEKITSSASSVFRVRVGPFLERDEANRIKAQLSEHLAVDGVVMNAD